jgi:Rrf2 family iron-sulfur cluster assembly transcriptional regulator
MILSTKGRYAVTALVELASLDKDKPVSLQILAERQNIPLAYLEQIFARLKKGGLVESVRGPGGGYRLAKPADDTFIGEIVLAADESLEMTRCGGSEKPGCMPNNARCLTHDLWEGLTEQIYNYLQAISLADVCEKRMPSRQFPVAGSESDFSMRLAADI